MSAFLGADNPALSLPGIFHQVPNGDMRCTNPVFLSLYQRFVAVLRYVHRPNTNPTVRDLEYTECLRAGIASYVRTSSALDAFQLNIRSVQKAHTSNDLLLVSLGDSCFSVLPAVTKDASTSTSSCPPPVSFVTVPAHRYEKAAKPSLITQLKRFIVNKRSHQVHPVSVRNYYSALYSPMAPSTKVPKKAPADGNVKKSGKKTTATTLTETRARVLRMPGSRYPARLVDAMTQEDLDNALAIQRRYDSDVAAALFDSAKKLSSPQRSDTTTSSEV